MAPKPNASDSPAVARQRILAAVRAIPAGAVAGYGEVARRAGLSGRARLVARILSAGDEPGLPWHRVLRSDGRIAFPGGSAGFDEQVQRPGFTGQARALPEVIASTVRAVDSHPVGVITE